MNSNNYFEPLISIVCNIYNGEEFISNCINSVLRQTYKKWEIIIWNNCSTDNTEEEIFKFKDKRIKYFKSTINTNLSTARNLAISKCKSDYVAFIDIDDFWKNTKLENQVKIIKKNPKLSFVFTKTKVINKKRNKESFLTKLLIKKLKNYNMLFIQNYIYFSSVIINRSLLNIFFDSQLDQAEDYDILLRLAKNGKFYEIKKELTFYLVHERNLSNIQFSKNFTESIYILRKHCKDIKYANLGLSINHLLLTKIYFRKFSLIMCITNLFLSAKLFFNFLFFNANSN